MKPLFIALSLLPGGRRPALPALTSDHRMLIVPNEDSDNVSVVSLERLEVIDIVPLRPGSRPWQAKVIPRTHVAHVTHSEFNGTAAASPTTPSRVSVVDIDRRAVVLEIEVGAGANSVTVVNWAVAATWPTCAATP